MVAEGRKKLHVPSWLIGVAIGEAIWAIACIGWYASEAIEPFLPRLFVRLDVADTVGSICGLIAFPIVLGGWLFIWGDNGPPYDWIERTDFNVFLGLSFYGLLGGLTGLVFPMFHDRRRIA